MATESSSRNGEYTDTDRLNWLEQDVAEEPMCLHNLPIGAKVPCRGLGLKPTGRTLRQALDQCMSANGVKPLVVSETQPRWIPCSDHDRLPNCDDVDIVLGWFPGMKHPRPCSPEEIKHWALDADPIPGAMWRPYPEAPKSDFDKAMELYPDRMEHHEARAAEKREGGKKP
jgi:hypothetical protein